MDDPLGIHKTKSEHILSPVPIRCHLADHEEMIITGTFDSVDENIGLDQNLIWKSILNTITKIDIKN